MRVDFPEVIIVRKRVSLTEEETPHTFQLPSFDVEDRKFLGVSSTVNHVAGVTYDLVTVVNVVTSDYLNSLTESIVSEHLAHELDAIDLIEPDEAE